MSKITDEITFTPGRLAKKLGISKSTLMRHLRDTGLIEQCRLTKVGHWKIPYSLAARISSVEALSLPSVNKTEREGRKCKKTNNTALVNSQSQVPFRDGGTPTAQPNYTQIGRTLRQAGVTMSGLLKYIEQQMEVVHEQSPYNHPKQDGHERSNEVTAESKSTDDTNTDISDSSAEQ